jgi:RNA polymerase II elongation factor ELL
MGTPQPNINKGKVKVENKPHPQFLAMFQNKTLKVTKTTKAAPNQTPVSSTNKSDMATAGADAALAQLQNSLASENLKKQENT